MTSPSINSVYNKYFTTVKVIEKLKKLPGKVFSLILFKVFLLYELLKKDDTSAMVKASIIAALGYLVCPIDAIPDLLPGGYTDDIVLMSALLTSLDHLINHEVTVQAKQRAARFKNDKNSHEI